MLKAVLFAASILLMTLIHAQVALQTTSGAIIKASNGAVITLNNADLILNSNFEQSAGDGSFRFTGNANNVIDGTVNLLLDTLTIAKTGTGRVLLNRNLRIGSAINFSSGLLDLTSGIIVLEGASVINGETNSAHIMGTGGFIETTANLSSPNNLNPGNLGAIFSATGNFGTTTIRRGHTSQVNGSGNGNSILRYYDIQPTVNAGALTLKFSYQDVELNGLTESDLVIWRRTMPPTWNLEGVDARNTSVNIVTKSGITQFGRFTLSTADNPLPLQFLGFTVSCNTGGVQAKVITAQEINVHHLELQASSDGQPWTSIQAQPASNTLGQHTYIFTDDIPVFGALYRVASVDIDGRQSFTDAIRSTCAVTSSFKAWPNPVHDRLTISVPGNITGKVAVIVYDAQGKTVMMQETRVTNASNLIMLDFGKLANGIYQVSLNANGIRKSIQVIK